MLRDFWFQFLLFCTGILVSIAGIFVEGNQRRLVFSLAILFTAAALLSYVWGDPVRGPFAKLIHPGSRDTFWLHAGIAAGFPVQQLKDGVDFSRAINLPGQPIELKIRRTWWSGWEYDLTVKGRLGEKVIALTNKKIEATPAGWDSNSDDNAIEIIDEKGLPRLQVIQAGDYDVYINTVLTGENQALVLKDDRLQFKHPSKLLVTDFPTRLFRYPSYAHKGRRE